MGCGSGGAGFVSGSFCSLTTSVRGARFGFFEAGEGELDAVGFGARRVYTTRVSLRRSRGVTPPYLRERDRCCR